MNNAKNTLLKKGFPLIAAAAMFSAGQEAMAAKLTVRVVDANTQQPVSGASVCMGSNTSPSEYGSAQTDASGEVVTSAPGNDFVLSVAGEGHGDYVRTMTARDFDIIYYVELKNGGDQSFCMRSKAVSKADLQGRAALKLVDVDVRSHSHGGGTVDVATEVQGLTPTHIRASTNSDFKGARWLPYRAVTRHQVNKVASEDLFVQVKRSLAVEGGSAEAFSVTRVGDLHWDD
ncbi:MAG: hypothetical protein ACPGSC_08285 [Granulosicoccaceae bacterium]